MSQSLIPSEIKFLRTLLVSLGSSLLFGLALAGTLLALGVFTTWIWAALLACLFAILALGIGALAWRYRRISAVKARRSLKTELAALEGQTRQAEKDLQQAIRAHGKSSHSRADRTWGAARSRQAARTRLHQLLARRAALQRQLTNHTPPTPGQVLAAALRPGLTTSTPSWAGYLGAGLLLLISTLCAGLTGLQIAAGLSPAPAPAPLLAAATSHTPAPAATGTVTPSATSPPTSTPTLTATVSATATSSPTATATQIPTATQDPLLALPGAACLPINTQRQPAEVLQVHDGDTIRVRLGGEGQEATVRYIGIDSPENGEYFDYQATAGNSQFVSGQTITLVMDVSETDRYDRLLRYVLTEAAFVNYALVRDGLATAADFPPDSACAGVLLDAQRQAQAEGLGLWAATPTPEVPPPGPVSGCDPAYPTVCIPPPPPDLDCPDVRPLRRFQVLPPDPHHFDGDGDGIGCES